MKKKKCGPYLRERLVNKRFQDNPEMEYSEKNFKLLKHIQGSKGNYCQNE